jgi:hypothetical protein
MTHKIIITCAFLTALLLSTSSIASTNIPKGFSCETVECKIRINKLKKFARNGSSHAQEIVAVAYLTGEGFEQDSKKAISYFTKSMKQGSGRSAWFLFAIYHYGMGIDKDKVKATEYLDFAVKKKEKEALFYKGASLLIDDINSQEALALLTEASDLKERNATYLLADYYAQQPSDSDKEKAAMLFLELKIKNFKDSAYRYNRVMDQLPKKSKTVVFQHDENIEHITITGRKLPVIEQLDHAIASLAEVYDSPNALGTRIRGNHKSTVKIHTVSGDLVQEYVVGRLLKGGSLFPSQNR